MAGKMAKVPKVYRHKTGQARVRIDGKDRYIGAYGSPEAERRYRELVGDFLLSKESQSPKRQQQRRTVAELLAAYWQHAQEYYRTESGEPSSEQGQMADVIRILRQEVPSDFPCADFGPLRLKAVREALIKRGLTRQGVNRRVERIVRIFRWGSENEIIDPATFHGLQAVQGLKRGRTAAPESSPVRAAPLADITAAVAKASPTIRDMVLVQLYSAMRPGELVEMRGADIDRSGEVWVYRPRTHKNAYRGQERLIFLGPRAQEILGPQLEGRDPEAFVFSPREAEEARRAKMRTERLEKQRAKFPSGRGEIQPSQVNRSKSNAQRRLGESYTVASYRRAVDRACEAAEVPKFSPHQIRHSAGTAIRRDFGLEGSQVALGHQHAAVSEIYSERDSDLARRIAAEIG